MDPCPACGGTGSRAEEIERTSDEPIEWEPYEREVFDDVRCHSCCGTGERDELGLIAGL